MSRLDRVYRRVLITKFFTKGWGKPENLKKIFKFRKIVANRETCQHLVPSDYPIHIDKDEMHSDYRLMEGHFLSPFSNYLPGVVPKEVEIANFQVILPKTWKHNKLKPVCLHLAGTGDHGYWRRRSSMAKPLLKEFGIASVLLENPYYGSRKPKQQLRSSLHNVSDLFVMGGCLILESQALFHWFERQGWGPIGITGTSMGGHMASLAATNWPKPISLVPCLSWSTASCVFTQGVMSDSIPWDVLQSQYFQDSVYHEEIGKMIGYPGKNQNSAYSLGQQFVREMEGNVDTTSTETDINSPLSTENLDLGVSSKNSSIQNPSSNPGSVNRNFSSVSVLNKSAAIGGSDLSKLNESQSSAGVKQEANKTAGFQTEPLSLKHTQSKYKLSSFTKTLDKVGDTSNLSKTLGLIGDASKKTSKVLQKETYDFMVGMMDECTHLANFSVPVDPTLIIIIAANNDAYVPRHQVQSLDVLWPGAEVRYIDRGHVTAFLLESSAFRRAIADSFDRQIAKYFS